MKSVTFEPGARELYVDIWAAVQNGERFIQGREKIRRIVKVYEALELVSTEIAIGDGQRGRVLNDDGGTMLFEDAEYDVFKEAVLLTCEKGYSGATPQTGIMVRVIDARRSIRCIDFVDSVKDVPKETLREAPKDATAAAEEPLALRS